MKRKWNPDAVAKNREFRQKYGPWLDGKRINSVAAYISVFAAASALIFAGSLALKCGNDWTDSFSGIIFYVLGAILWIWNSFVGLFLAAMALNYYGIKHRHRLPVLRISVLATLLGVVVTSGMTVSSIALDLELRESQVCSK